MFILYLMASHFGESPRIYNVQELTANDGLLSISKLYIYNIFYKIFIYI